jgi:LPS-assembly protein
MKKPIIFLCVLICNFLYINVFANTFRQIGDFSFTAVNLSYNYQSNILFATGDVIIKGDDFFISADSIYYDSNNKIMIGKGNVTYKTDKNETFFMDYLEFDAEISAFLMEQIFITFGQESTIKADTITKQNKEEFCATDMLFTFCQIKEHSKPTWELYSKYGIYNEDQNTVSLYNPILKIKGFPVFWLPYLQLSNLQNKRKSGLLPFKYSNNSYNGYSLTIPLYIPIGLSNDLVFNTHLYSKNLNFFNKTQNPLLSGSYNGYLFKSEVSSQFSYIQNDSINSLNSNWHLFLKGITYNNDYIRTSYKLEKTSDVLYLNRYQINPNPSSVSFITQEVNYEVFLENNYIVASYRDYENLYNKVIYKEIKLEHLFLYNLNNLGNITVKTQTLSFFNDENKKLNYYFASQPSFRAVNNINYNKEVNLLVGVITNTLELQTAYYNTSKADLEQNNSVSNNINQHNDVYVVMGFENIYKIPISYTAQNNLFFIDPSIGTSYSKKILYNKYIQKTDNSNVYYSGNNLMFINHYSGFDNYEEKVALKYGLNTQLIKEDNDIFSAFIGQLINFKSTSKNSGDDKIEKTNYFLTSSWSPIKSLRLSFEGVADLNFKLISNNSNLNYSNNYFNLGLNYNYYNDLDETIFSYYKNEEINSYLNISFFTFFSLKANASFSLYNKEQAKLLSAKKDLQLKALTYSISYLDDCLSVILSIQQDIYKNVPNSYNFQIIIKKF